jgi:hypothetical protein
MMGGEKRKIDEENMENSMKRIKITLLEGIPELPSFTISTRSNYQNNHSLGQLVQQRRKEREEGLEQSVYDKYESINKELGELHKNK